MPVPALMQVCRESRHEDMHDTLCLSQSQYTAYTWANYDVE